MLLHRLLDLYTLIVFASVIVSWIKVSPDNPIVKVTDTLVEPVLTPIRKVLPPMGGIDFSAFVLLIALGALRRLI